MPGVVRVGEHGYRPPMYRILFLAFLLTACTDFPEVTAASRDVAGPAPALLPLDQLLASPAPLAEARGDALAAEAAALRRRAVR